MTPNRRRVLAIDDEHLMRMAYGHRLRELGYSIDTASDCDEALDLLDRAAYDLVLVDADLPALDRSMALVLARERNPGVRIILLTDDPGAVDEDDALFDGVDAILRKPCPLQDLANEAGRLLGLPPRADLS